MDGWMDGWMPHAGTYKSAAVSVSN